MNPAKFGGFLFANLLFCLWIGYLLDTWTHMSPLWMIVFVLYAIVGSFFLLIHKKRKNEAAAKDGRDDADSVKNADREH